MSVTPVLIDSFERFDVGLEGMLGHLLEDLIEDSMPQMVQNRSSIIIKKAPSAKLSGKRFCRYHQNHCKTFDPIIKTA